ncbi:LysR substrate-binding domain-containing protein [Ramlibacter albus]|uniref:LysR family transcriptional regulator n=1 Tax=Ramlibacter albus TaxID=2079448 RepID=A0A923M345_9BURK|nr:LysR substrate-binding domain-containing protein [Ramlibacter albus]MBC5763035.1 LysR family transcriptional regulator [Ramlibacter albus]
MTLTQLRYLVAIVDHGFNISKAANAVHTSQPGVSKQIRLLEAELGINILERSAGRIVGLTEQGLNVAESAKAILKEANRLRAMGEDVLQQDVGELRIACLHAHAVSVLPGAVVAVQKAFPEVSVQVQQASAARCYELLKSGDIDFGITIEQPPAPYQLMSIPLGSSPRILLVPEGHELLGKGPVALQDIAAHRMLISRDTGANWDVMREIHRQGIELRPTVSLTDGAVIKAFVRAGAGIAIISSASFDEREDAALRAIDIGHIFGPGQTFAVFDPFRYMRGFGYHFIEQLAPHWTRQKVESEIRSFIYA